MFGQSLLSAFGIACTTDTDQLFTAPTSTASLATFELNSNANSIPYNNIDTSIATYQLNASPVTSIPGNNYPGTASNITFAAGKFGNAAVFNGSNSKIIANGKPLNNNTSITISFWARNISSSDWKTLLGEGGDSGNTPGYKIYTSPPSVANSNYLWMARADNSGYVFDTYDGSAANKGGVDMGVAGSTWVHCVFTVSPTQLIVYKNGVNVKSLSISNTSSVVGYYDFQFMYDTKYNRYLQGELDQVRLFDTTLSQAAVTALYNETTTTAQSASISYSVSYNGTENNITYGTGKFGNAAVFNGSSSYIDTGVNGHTIAWGYAAWFNTTSTSGAILATLAGSGSNSGVDIIMQSGGALRCLFHQNGSNISSNYTFGSGLNDGNWHFVSYTWDGVNGNPATIQIDGTKYTQSSSISGGTNADASLKIGRFGSSAGGGFFNGKIDQVRIFNKKLSNLELDTLYAETATTAQSNNINYQAPNPNSIAYYKMSDATDQLGNYNGTATNVNFNTEGKFGFAGAFNGSSSRIILGTSQDFSVTKTGEISFSLWIKTTTSGTGYVFSKGNDATVEYEYFLELLQPSGKLNWRAVNNSDLVAAQVTPNTVVTDGNWHHIVGVIVNNTSVTLYIDGVATTSSSWSGTISYYANNCLIGHGDGIPASGAWFEGDIDQIRIYDSAISAADVNTLYKEVECEPAAINALDHFNTVIYTGNGPQQVGFKPDFTWIKNRDSTPDHVLFDTIRGVQKFIRSNNTDPEATGSGASGQDYLSSFNTNGFTVGNASNTGSNSVDYVSWNWKAGGSAVSNTDGSITSTVTANVEAGFSIVKYTGSTPNQTIGHGLGKIPELIIVKNLDVSGNGWATQSPYSGGADYHMMLNSTQAAQNNVDWIWNDTEPTSTVFTVGQNSITNGNGENHISYCFVSIPGYSKIGSYTSTYPNTTSVYVGFQPRFVMIKSYNQTRNWVIHDSARGADEQLYANLNNAEGNTGTDLQFTSTGFNVSGGGNDLDGGSSYSYIFLAIA